ncbi:UDP-glucose:glycoprotein glucosyltransferase [Venturia inaequalis]|nr:UDP-glucose:glycoprotein glucosyltransferase [Venturia inaequalis]
MNLTALLTLAFATMIVALPSEKIGLPPQKCHNGCPVDRLGGCPPNCT